MAAVLVQGVSKTFPSTKRSETAAHALRNVHLSVEEGELLVLVGPSGSGKTTLLRIVAGLERPSSGTLFIGGRDMAQVSAAERGVSMVFQESSLYPHMTVRENLAFGLKLRHLGKEEILTRVEEAATLLGLTSFLGRGPDTLSGGERQRVALGRAMALHPQLFLLDEPFSQLDAPLRAQMRRELLALQRNMRATMIYVTHDQFEAMTMADRLAVINNGQIEQVGSPQELYRRPSNVFVALFLGTPPINLLPGTIGAVGDRLAFRTNDGLKLVLDSDGASILSTRIGAEIVLGFRPEHFRIAGAEEAKAALGSFPVTIDRVETVGWETHFWTSSGAGQKIVVRVSPEFSGRAGDQIWLVASMAQAHFFEPHSGERVG
jgi:ABC-type sugar transport system ATPase subunit